MGRKPTIQIHTHARIYMQYTRRYRHGVKQVQKRTILPIERYCYGTGSWKKYFIFQKVVTVNLTIERFLFFSSLFNHSSALLCDRLFSFISVKRRHIVCSAYRESQYPVLTFDKTQISQKYIIFFRLPYIFKNAIHSKIENVYNLFVSSVFEYEDDVADVK